MQPSIIVEEKHVTICTNQQQGQEQEQFASSYSDENILTGEHVDKNNSSNNSRITRQHEEMKQSSDHVVVDETLKYHPISCNKCRIRHTKCDKLLPSCSYCLSNHVECIYESPKKLRKTNLAELVDLNHPQAKSCVLLHGSQHVATNSLKNPKSKYKVYKFSVVGEEQHIKKKRNRRNKNVEHASMHPSQIEQALSHSTTSNLSHLNNTHHDIQQYETQFRDMVNYLDEKLLLKSFRTDAYTYYTQYVAFGICLLSIQTIERVYEFVDEDQSTQLYPEDVLSLIYAIHAVNLFLFEQREVSFRSFEKSLRLLQYDSLSIESLFVCLDITMNNSRSVLCLSSESSEVYFSSGNRDHNSLSLISARLMLVQYCLCMGFIPTANHFLGEADIMLKNRFPTYRDQSHLPSHSIFGITEPTSSLYEGLSPEEIYVLKYRTVCGVKMDDIRFFQERWAQYIGFSTPQSFEPYTRTSSVLSDDPKYIFSSYVNKCIFGSALFIFGMGKMDLLNLVLSTNMILKEQPNIAYMIIGVLDFNGKLLKKITAARWKLDEEEVNSMVISKEISHRYQDLAFIFQKIFMTSYSFLVLHEVVINYSNPFTLMTSNRNEEIDVEKVKKCLDFRNEFADELSDLFSVLPDYTINFLGLVIVSVFLVAKIHHDRLIDRGMHADQHLIRRMKNDFRVMLVLRKKFPHLFENPQLVSFYSSIEHQIARSGSGI